MRSDMDKVIVERPRVGSRLPPRKKGYRKYLQSTAVDELPLSEPMLGRWKGQEKILNEHLGPMRRFLRSNVGRPWNKVHQELCEHVSFDNAVQSHVLAHIYQYVHLHVEVRDSSTVFSHYRWRRHWPLKENDMYVCPASGILKVVRPERAKRPKTRISAGPFTQYHFRDNAWWELRLGRKENAAADRWEVWLEQKISQLTDEECNDIYGDKLIAISKRPLTPTETRELYRKQRSKLRKK